MRIVALTATYPRYEGDALGNFVHGNLVALAGLGHEVTVVAPGHEGLPAHAVLDGVHVERFSYVRPKRWERIAYGEGVLVNLRRRPAQRLLLPAFFAAFFCRALTASRGADVLFPQWTFSALVALAVRAVRRVPVILVTHGSDIHRMRPGGLGERLNRFIVRRCDHVVCVSEELRQSVIRLGAATRNATRIGYSIDTAMFSPGDRQAARQSLDLPREGVIALYVGRLIRDKGVLEAMEAFAAAVREEPRLFLCLVGDGELRGVLERQVREAGVGRAVRLAGAQPHAAIPQYLHACDFLVLPSYGEGMPLTVMEALACGVPVVASAVGAIPDLVEDRRTGRLVRPGDIAGLRHALVGMARDDRRREEMAEEVRRRRFAEAFDAKARAREYEGVFRAVLDRRRTGW